MNALTCPNRMPSETGCSQSIGAVRRARVSGAHVPVRWMRRHPAYQTIAAVAAIWMAVHSQPATPKGSSANGRASTAANGGYVNGSSCGGSVIAE